MADRGPDAPAGGADELSLRRWFALYGAVLAAALLTAAALSSGQAWSWSELTADGGKALARVSPAIKLLLFAAYLSLCCTFLPLPTGWVVAAVATRQAAVAGSLWPTVMLVALAGAAGSTLANLNDYHLFTWLLRSRRIARVRSTRTYATASRWFARNGFFILVVFNIVPIPVDVVRMLAATSRYPRGPFAAANFIGRFARYAVIAFVTFWWDLGWIAVVTLLALAVALAAGRAGAAAAGRFARRNGNAGPDETLVTDEAMVTKEQG